MIELINEIFFQNHLDTIYNQTDLLIEKEDIQGIANSFVYSLKSSIGLKIIYQSIKYVSSIKNKIVNSIEYNFNQTAMKKMKHVKETATNVNLIYFF
jgi:hypothetical protein